MTARDDALSTGRLYLASDGALRLSVPSALVRGLSETIHAPGTQCVLDLEGKGFGQPHVLVMTCGEVRKIGPERIDERGRPFSYKLGQVRSIAVSGNGLERVWLLEVVSPELEALRHSYGLPSKPGRAGFYVPLAVRKAKVLEPNGISKAADDLDVMAGIPKVRPPRRRAISREFISMKRRVQFLQKIIRAWNRYWSKKASLGVVPEEEHPCPYGLSKEASPRLSPDFGDLSVLDEGQILTLTVQEHRARKAGKHFDVRLGNPRLGMFSWATRKGFPAPGDKPRGFYQTPIHPYDYKDFEGELTSGYGAGKVRKVYETSVRILQATPDAVRFQEIVNGKPGEVFLLTRRRNSKPDSWVAINITPRDARRQKNEESRA